jgi:hypothetical protein
MFQGAAVACGRVLRPLSREKVCELPFPAASRADSSAPFFAELKLASMNGSLARSARPLSAVSNLPSPLSYSGSAMAG